ncbi:MAG: sialidase family protein [Bryobacteraceae bacterium]
MAIGCAKLCIILCLSALGAGAGIRTSAVFGTETATGPYKHPASVAELANGDLYLAYYGGGGEYERETAVYGARRAKGSSEWTRPAAIARDPFRSVGNAVVWQAPDGAVWLFYVVRYGETWSTSRIQMKVSRDGARTWSDPSMLAVAGMPAEGMMVRNAPVVLPSGEYLLPLYHEAGGDRESVGKDSTSRFARFDPKTGQWKASGVVRSAKGNIQPAPASLGDGRVIAFCRRGGGYGPVTDGYLVRAESTDGGRTWSEGRDSEFPNPNSAVDLLRLRNGRLMLVYNASMSERTPLRVAVSEDGGRSWPRQVDIGTGKNSFAYPFAIQKRDGGIAVVYTTDGRKRIMLCEFEEADIPAVAKVLP